MGHARSESTDAQLEALRSLILLKAEIASDAFARLVASVENDEVARAFQEVAAAAQDERLELETLLASWAGASPRRRTEADLSYRDVVAEWAALHESLAGRATEVAARAPTAEIAERLRRVAATDRAHARRLRALL